MADRYIYARKPGADRWEQPPEQDWDGLARRLLTALSVFRFNLPSPSPGPRPFPSHPIPSHPSSLWETPDAADGNPPSVLYTRDFVHFQHRQLCIGICNGIGIMHMHLHLQLHLRLPLPLPASSVPFLFQNPISFSPLIAAAPAPAPMPCVPACLCLLLRLLL